MIVYDDVFLKLKASLCKTDEKASILKLKNMVKEWPPYERPIDWHLCPELCKNSLGKWEIQKWQSWIKAKQV